MKARKRTGILAKTPRRCALGADEPHEEHLDGDRTPSHGIAWAVVASEPHDRLEQIAIVTVPAECGTKGRDEKPLFQIAPVVIAPNRSDEALTSVGQGVHHPLDDRPAPRP